MGGVPRVIDGCKAEALRTGSLESLQYVTRNDKKAIRRCVGAAWLRRVRGRRRTRGCDGDVHACLCRWLSAQRASGTASVPEIEELAAVLGSATTATNGGSRSSTALVRLHSEAGGLDLLHHHFIGTSLSLHYHSIITSLSLLYHKLAFSTRSPLTCVPPEASSARDRGSAWW